MAPKTKFDANDPAAAATISQFQSIGLTQAKATDVARNPKNATCLSDLVQQNSLQDKGLDAKQGALLTTLAVSGQQLDQPGRNYICAAIVDGRLKSEDQVTGEQLVR
jgi:glutaminyl-tRNA synthetase